MNILQNLSKIKYKTETVDASEYGEGEVIIIRELSAKAKARISLLASESKDFLDVNDLSIMYSIIDEQGNYQLKNESDLAKVLDNIPDSLYMKLTNAIIKLNQRDQDIKN